MSGHCTGLLGRMNLSRSVSGRAAVLAAGGAMVQTQPPDGFKHLIKTPRPDQRFGLDGVPFDPTDPSQLEKARIQMRQLANVIEAAPVPTGFEDGLSKRFNRGLPSGYTYLLQLIAHDLVQSSNTISRGSDPRLGFANLRQRPLRLETVYGGGPAQCPMAYDPGEDGSQLRLRLGAARDDAAGRLRDIARGSCAGREGLGLSEAFIADPRNDMHAMISQLTVAFSHLHNSLVDVLEADATIHPSDDPAISLQQIFLAAHGACVILYRHLIKADLLPRLLHPAVSAAYALRPAARLQSADPAAEDDGWLAPLELTHGVLRFGHAMIRPTYSFNANSAFPSGPRDPDKSFRLDDALSFNSESRPTEMPLSIDWTIDWQRFFGDDPAASNFSVRIGPWTHSRLEGAVRSEAPAGGGTLTYRDLMSAAMATPWSVAALAEKIAEMDGGLLRQSALFAAAGDPRPWADPISRWLKDNRGRADDTLSLEDIATLAEDPPLPFFVRFEAAQAGTDGKRLGVLGSTILADVIYGIFERDRIFGIDHIRPVGEQLAELSRSLLGSPAAALIALGQIQTVMGMIQHLGERLRFPAGALS